LQIERRVEIDLEKLKRGSMQIIEIMLSPFSDLTGKTLRELHFSEKYGVSVLAIWRGDRAYRTNLAEIPLNYGDALLCYGPLERFEMIARDRDFVVLKTEVQEKPRLEKAPISALDYGRSGWGCHLLWPADFDCWYYGMCPDGGDPLFDDGRSLPGYRLAICLFDCSNASLGPGYATDRRGGLSGRPGDRPGGRLWSYGDPGWLDGVGQWLPRRLCPAQW
jgi:hypothetical protein